MCLLTRADITVKDISKITRQFWKIHQQALGTLDAGDFTLFTIQCNLFVGTLAPFAMKRPVFQPVLQAALDSNVS